MRGAAFALLIVLATACGDRTTSTVPNASAPAAAATATPAPAPSETGAIVTRPTTSASPAARPTELVARAKADFDCDGKADDFALFVDPTPGPSANLAWRAQLVLASGNVYETDFVAIRSTTSQQIVGVADVNGDGCADAVVDVGHGASTTWVEFFVFDGTALREVRDLDKPFVFEGSVRHGSGIECRKTGSVMELVTRAVSNATNDYQWDLVEHVYQWSGKADLVLVSTRTMVITVAQAHEQPPEMWRYWALSCGALRTPAYAFASR